MHNSELYGYSLFETFLAKSGTFWRLRAHWQRLRESARNFDLILPDWPYFVQAVRDVHEPTGDEVLRFTLFQNGGRWSSEPTLCRYDVLKRPWQKPHAEEVRLFFDPDLSLPCRDMMRCHKTGSRMQYQVLFNLAVKAGYDDCLLVDQEGSILETTHYNVFLSMGGEWFTAPVSQGLLPGVARSWILEKLAIHERPIKVADLKYCQGVVICNAVMGARVVTAVGDMHFGNRDAESLIRKLGERQFEPLPIDRAD